MKKPEKKKIIRKPGVKPAPRVPEKPSEKEGFHPRNPHRFAYDFQALMKSSPKLAYYVSANEHGNPSINFFVPAAVKALNRALLKHFYDVDHWDIPEGYLCPPIPGRADYIHYMADLLAELNAGKVPGRGVRVLDIGVGANCVYPIIGHMEYGWEFVGTDIDPVAVKAAEQNITSNLPLKGAVECRLQRSSLNTFKGVVLPGELYDLSVCNPPFHASLAEALGLTEKKLKNLGAPTGGDKPVQNFGGQHAELWCKGGEKEFIERMIAQSVMVARQVLWFSTLVSKKDNLTGIYSALKKAGVADLRTISMTHGHKVSRIVAWTFFSAEQQQEWVGKRWGSSQESPGA
jgi:23S rRNA (adenine1618-N6)-methyltransferase